jgi:hypothetical protein
LKTSDEGQTPQLDLIEFLWDLVDLVGVELIDLALCGVVSAFCRRGCLTDLSDSSDRFLAMLVGER